MIFPFVSVMCFFALLLLVRHNTSLFVLLSFVSFLTPHAFVYCVLVDKGGDPLCTRSGAFACWDEVGSLGCQPS